MRSTTARSPPADRVRTSRCMRRHQHAIECHGAGEDQDSGDRHWAVAEQAAPGSAERLHGRIPLLQRRHERAPTHPDAPVEGSQARLPAPGPRGTVLDSFPSHGSSSTKASVNTPLTRELGIRSERPSRYTPAAVVHVLRQCWGRTRPWCCVHLHSPHTNGSPNFHATYHLSDVGPLSCQVTSKPVSAPLQRGIRFFRHPTSAPP